MTSAPFIIWGREVISSYGFIPLFLRFEGKDVLRKKSPSQFLKPAFTFFEPFLSVHIPSPTSSTSPRVILTAPLRGRSSSVCISQGRKQRPRAGLPESTEPVRRETGLHPAPSTPIWERVLENREPGWPTRFSEHIYEGGRMCRRGKGERSSSSSGLKILFKENRICVLTNL